MRLIASLGLYILETTHLLRIIACTLTCATVVATMRSRTTAPLPANANHDWAADAASPAVMGMSVGGAKKINALTS